MKNSKTGWIKVNDSVVSEIENNYPIIYTFVNNFNSNIKLLDVVDEDGVVIGEFKKIENNQISAVYKNINNKNQKLEIGF